MIAIRKPEDIHLASGVIENGTFLGRWAFSFGEYYDPQSMGFGALRVFNDDTLSPGAVWPLHPIRHEGALPIHQDAAVFSCLLKSTRTVQHDLPAGRGAYLYVVQGGPVGVAGMPVREFGAAKVSGEPSVSVSSKKDAELLLVDLALT